MRKWRSYRRHRGDSLQLGGDVVVGAEGRVAWTFFPKEPDTRPTTDQIEVAVDAAGAVRDHDRRAEPVQHLPDGVRHGSEWEAREAAVRKVADVEEIQADDLLHAS